MRRCWMALGVGLVALGAPLAEVRAQCASDGDCKGDRVCQAGACVSAPAQKACAKDTDCPGDEVCAEGVCKLDRAASAPAPVPVPAPVPEPAPAPGEPVGAPPPAPPPVEPAPAAPPSSTPWYEQGAPAPVVTSGPAVVPYTAPPPPAGDVDYGGGGGVDGPKMLAWTGFGTFVCSWVGTMIATAAAAPPSEDGTESIIPVAGPFIILGEKNVADNFVPGLVLGGVFQIVGLSLFIVGVASENNTASAPASTFYAGPATTLGPGTSGEDDGSGFAAYYARQWTF